MVAGDVDADERACLLALHQAPGVGVATARRLVKRFGGVQGVFKSSRRDLEACGIKGIVADSLQTPNWKRVGEALKWAEQPGHHLLLWGDTAYPPLLREIPDPPGLLFVHGHLAVLSRLQLAVVGSRNPSVGGERIAYELSRGLAEAGFTLASGLALGIDAAAHRGALAAGGATIAVAGTGVDRVYPAVHQNLAVEITATGAVLSEFPLGTPPRRQNFPRRNRIISGLARGTVVVEAGLRSGSLVTARHALEQGREVFAVPGSIHNPLARGCHVLIRAGATLVEGVEDILEELAPELGGRYVSPPAEIEHGPAADVDSLDTEYCRLLGCMGLDPVPIDFLVECSGLTANSVSSMLLILELQGYVRSQAGGLYLRLPTLVGKTP